MTIRLRRFAAELLAGIVPALVAAALHLLIVVIRRRYVPSLHWDWNTRDAIWMIPLGYQLVFAIAALPPALIAMLRRQGLPRRARVWYWTSLTAFAVLLLFYTIHTVAWIVVALAIGYQVSLQAQRNPRAARRIFIPLVTVVAIVLPAVALGSALRHVLRGRHMLANIQSAPPDAPNILLLIWDTARAQSMSLYGYYRATTPFLDSLAQHAVVFDHAHSTAPWTLPSHATMLTGLYPADLTADWTSPLAQDHRTLAEALYYDGYATGAFISNFFAASYPTGLHQGFIRYEAVKRTLEEVLLSTTLTQTRTFHLVKHRVRVQRWYSQALKDLLLFDGRPMDVYQVHDKKDAATVSASFLAWQASVRRPYFAMLNYMEAHAGYASPTDTLYQGGRTREDQYDGSIWWLDRELRQLFQTLRERGDLENTIVILTSDHGEHFGEHGNFGHGVSLYLPVLRVPLVVYGPKWIPEGVRVTRAVSLRDLPRTIQALAGSSQAPFPGEPLLRLLHDPQAPVSPVIAEVSKGVNQVMDTPISAGKLMAAIDDSLHAIRDAQGDLKVFAYRTDPAEEHDLAQDAQRRFALEEWFTDRVRAAGLRVPDPLLPPDHP